MKAKFRWLAIALASVAASGASATTYLYHYTGQDLTNVTSSCCGADTPFTTSDFIDFRFTSTGVLAPNQDDVGFAAPITAWSLSVGPLHYSNTDPGSVLYSINFSTDGLGRITDYQFTTQTDVGAPNLLPAEYPPTIYEEEVFSFNIPPIGYGPEDGIYIPSIFQDSAYASNVGSPGSWTISAAPEPARWILMLIGFGGLGAALRTRRRSAAVA
ncbi:MAG TPA: PEP-CTERM sorting domain-containing protein [Phenylobacterium sp.]|jgi:hypothetical protein|nr:PEP-CTERM sorting domain-containing protein [Phenylobacterium sp.]